MNLIAVSGYYGAGNVGDEAILEALVSLLRRLLPGTEIAVFSLDPDGTAARYGVRGVSRRDLRAVLSVLRRADLLISGGGGLLQDVTGPASIPYYLGMTALARLCGTPVVLLGQSVGPVGRRSSRAIARLLLPLSRRAVVRDGVSADLLRGLGYPAQRLDVAADLVFAGERPDAARGRDILAGMGLDTGRPLIMLALRSWGGDEHLKAAGRAAAGAAEARGGSLLFLPFHLQGGDLEASRLSCAAAGTGSVIEAGLSTGEARDLIAAADLLVGMRYHSLIFAVMAGVPALAVEYDPKVSAAVRDFGLPSVGRPEEADESLFSLGLEKTFAEADALAARMLRQAAEMRELTEKGVRQAVCC